VNACVYYEQGFKQWLLGKVWRVCVVDLVKELLIGLRQTQTDKEERGKRKEARSKKQEERI